MYLLQRKIVIIFIILAYVNSGYSQEAGGFINVHFLYGSKPLKAYRNTERKWFGGILGGHVGIETEQGKVLNFMRKGKIHVFASSKNKKSRYAIHSTNDFWGIFRTPASAVKKTTVVIPLSSPQRQVLDSLSSAYLQQTPYDYAFFGMRCGAATYDILARLDIVKSYSYRRTFMKIFYPKKLRKRLLRIASQNNWEIIRQEGAISRKWERD